MGTVNSVYLLVIFHTSLPTIPAVAMCGFSGFTLAAQGAHGMDGMGLESEAMYTSLQSPSEVLQ